MRLVFHSARLTWLLLALQIGLGAASAPGFVLCVANDGHVAIEDSVAAARCAQSLGLFAAGSWEGAELAQPAGACLDTPILAAAADLKPASSRLGAEFAAGLLIYFAAPAMAIPSQSRARFVPVQRPAGAILALHRTVVLRI